MLFRSMPIEESIGVRLVCANAVFTVVTVIKSAMTVMIALASIENFLPKSNIKMTY